MKRFDGDRSLRQLFLHRDDEIQVLEVHVRSQDPADTMISHLRPDVDIETRKKPLPGTPTVSVFGPPTSKFVFARLAQMVCSEDTRVYTGSGRTSLRLVCCYLYYRHLFGSRGYKQAREGNDPKSLVERVNGC